MGKKRAHSPPPPVESSEDVESESASSEEEEEEEEEQQHHANPNPNADDNDGESGEDESGEEEDEEEEESGEEEDDNNKKAPAAVPQSSEESESDTDPPMVVKPISSKPMPAAESSEKAALFQRVWSLEDEIALLKGILDYKSKTGIIPQPSNKKPGEFPDLVKKSLNMDATVGQIVEKVRRLKNKYDKAAARSAPQFATPHDRTMFEISEKIWGDEPPVTAANGRDAAVGNNGYPFLREAIVAKGVEFTALVALEKLEPVKARMLEEKFKKQKMAVMKHHIQKMELQKETFKLIMDGIDKSG